MTQFWQKKVKAFLHDPPDKALKILGHETRRDLLLKIIGLKYDEDLNPADHIASAMQRLSIPRECEGLIIDFHHENMPLFKHPISAEAELLTQFKKFVKASGYDKCFEMMGFKPEILRELVDERSWMKSYLMVWRLLPEKYSYGDFLPAETRIPVDCIWDHLDVTAALVSTLIIGPKEGFAMFSVKIPAVQEFIFHSRKLVDLWAGSHLLSYLIFKGILVLVEKLGPDVVIFPYLRGQLFLDFLWLIKKFPEFQKYLKMNDEVKKKLRVASLPNNFLAIVPHQEVEKIAQEIKDNILSALMKIADYIKKMLKDKQIIFNEELWNKQLEGTFLVTTSYLKIPNPNFYREQLRELIPEDLRKNCDRVLECADKIWYSNIGHFYDLSFKLLQLILTQQSRLFNQHKENGGRKCSMCGIRNAVVTMKSELEKLKLSFPKEFKEDEYLCGVCLTKRFYRHFMEKNFEISLSFSAVAEIAAYDFIKEVLPTHHNLREKIEEISEDLVYVEAWNDKDIKRKISEEERKVLIEKLENLYKTYFKPNKYYSIALIDADHIGKMLSGEKLPNFKEFLHPRFEKCIKNVTIQEIQDVLKTERILSPSVHMCISKALKDFSTYKVWEIIKKYDGFLVYSGGDDVLALFPANRALNATKEVRKTFSEAFYEIKGKKIMGLGRYASMSASIVFTHYKYPLYDALRQTRDTLRTAKDEYGRDAFVLKFIKRSGELLEAGCKWDMAEDLESVAKTIVNGEVSHSFIQDFMDVVRVLEGEMLISELGRLLKRRGQSKKKAIEIHGKISCLVEKFKAYNIKVEKLAYAIKILYDAMRGEE